MSNEAESGREPFNPDAGQAQSSGGAAGATGASQEGGEQAGPGGRSGRRGMNRRRGPRGGRRREKSSSEDQGSPEGRHAVEGQAPRDGEAEQTGPTTGEGQAERGPQPERGGRNGRGGRTGRGGRRRSGARPGGGDLSARGDSVDDSDPLPIHAESAVVGLEAGRGARGGGAAFNEEDLPKLHKVLADSGLGSRRDMEEWIVAGRISVNGMPAHIGQRIAPNDQIRVNGRPLNRKPAQQAARVLLYHKPAGEIASRDDPGQRATVFERLPKMKGARWVAVGRLDFNTEGLLIFTTSGDLANRLMHPRYGWEREYAVRVLGRVDDEARQKLLAGVQLEDGPAAFAKIDDVGGDGANHWYRVVISEGRNREVRRMFEAVGLTVSRLVRIRFGPVGLPRAVARGRWIELSATEVIALLQLVKRAGQPASDAAGTGDSEGVEFASQDARDTQPRWHDDPDHDFDADEEDDDWQPTSANAHQEGITRQVRQGEPGAGGGRAGNRQGRRGRGQSPNAAFGDAGFGAMRMPGQESSAGNARGNRKSRGGGYGGGAGGSRGQGGGPGPGGGQAKGGGQSRGGGQNPGNPGGGGRSGRGRNRKRSPNN